MVGGADDDVLDRRAVDGGNLVQQRVDDEGTEVVGPRVDQRALEGPANRRTGRRSDHSFRHGGTPPWARTSRPEPIATPFFSDFRTDAVPKSEKNRRGYAGGTVGW